MTVLSDTDPITLWRAALAAALGLLIGWERRVTGSAIEARTIGLAALVYVIIASREWPVLTLLRGRSSGTVADAATEEGR